MMLVSSLLHWLPLRDMSLSDIDLCLSGCDTQFDVICCPVTEYPGIWLMLWEHMPNAMVAKQFERISATLTGYWRELCREPAKQPNYSKD